MHLYMNRQIVVFCVLLCVFVGAATVAHAQATDLHDAAAQLTKKLHDDSDVQKITGEHIVIAPFENINGKGDAVPRILQEMLTTSFIKAKHFKVLERDQLQSALDELHFQLSDLADPAKAKKIGKLAGATYVLLGSISDTGSSTSINARIVSIESGESVAADDIDIKTGDNASGVGGLNPAANPLTTSSETTTPVTAAKPQTPAIDLNAKATSTSAGEYIGQKGNFGLLSGTKFQIAWREPLGQQRVHSFSAGDLLGDGSSRLILSTADVLSVQKWTEGKFKETWESDHVYMNDDDCFVRVLALSGKPSVVFVSYLVAYDNIGSPTAYGITEIIRWDGTSYASEWEEPRTTVFNVALTSSANLIGEVSGCPCLLKYTINSDTTGPLTRLNNRPFTDTGRSDVVAADFDGDGKMELAAIVATDIKAEPKPIEIYSLDGTRKAITSAGYGARLGVWNPNGSKHPFLVARRNTPDADGKPNGGYIYFIQWNGESYGEVWKSNRIDDAIIDMQVCDPKGEGKPGLVILSADKKGCYLTKIVHVN